MEPASTLLKEFRKSYTTIEKLQQEWQISLESSFPVIESLLNLSEQLQCCEEGTFEIELQKDFPDVKQRLTYKILMAMEGKMKKLKDLLNSFENIKNKIEALRDSTLKMCLGFTSEKNLEILATGTATSPPPAALMEWLMDLNRWYNSLYEQKKDLLDNIRYNDHMYFQSLLKKWKDESCLYRVKGIMEQVSMFLSSG